MLFASYHEIKLPLAWKQANVTPLHKEKLVRDINKHLRPISLTSAISKLTEDFVVEQYVSPAIMEVIDPHQFGGISRSSATHASRQMNDRQALYSEKPCTQPRLGFKIVFRIHDLTIIHLS